jgi:DNA-binding FrmR family transcriptional regulator
MLLGFGIDRHAADRIEHACCGRREVVMMAVAGVIAVSVRRFVRPDHPAKISGLETYTLWGYIRPMRTDIKTSVQKRLNRIEGQVRGLSKMVEEDRYCIDIVTQISAVRAALRRVEEEVLKDHVAHCVEHAITSGDQTDQRQKISELMEVIGRADR